MRGGAVVWAATVRRLRVDGAPVRLAGYRLQDPDTVDVLGDTHRITLLVVPPEATKVAGHQAMALAADPANTDSPTRLLVASSVRIAPRLVVRAGDGGAAAT